MSVTRNHDKERYDRAKRISQEMLDAERAQRAEKTARLRQARLAQRPVESSPPQPQTHRNPTKLSKKKP
ncbi:hypothetical protein [Mesorhizobium sp. CO1-1-8]|uniref:hypothetical protein n=1 Tax=Mesorhizobium sp. CO1-1-8 TaxID=2876631 RepID=UPI001CD15955|nr:hypothetical protein [Mesorhizobium sp. CO1-1-8]MBZ9773302.1 hypothetical protein [Mesorhizobium sp. CO1-1-8]